MSSRIEPTLLPPTWHSVVVWWTRPVMYLYMPLSYTAWGVLALIAQRPDQGGVRLIPFPFHFANLLLHLLTVLVAYRLLVLLVKRRWPAAAGAACSPCTRCRSKLSPGRWDSQSALASCSCCRHCGNTCCPARPALAFCGGDGVLRAGAAGQAVGDGDAVHRGSVGCRGGAPHAYAGLAVASAPFENERNGAALGLWAIMAIPIGLVARHASRSIASPNTCRSGIGRSWRLMLAFYVGKLLFPVRLCIDYGRSPIKIFDTGQAYWTWLIPTAIAVVLVVWAPATNGAGGGGGVCPGALAGAGIRGV